MKHWVRLVCTQWLAVALGLMNPLKSWGGDERYDCGNLIDLATVRGVVATASDSLRKDQPPAGFLLHRAEGEIRFNNNFGACWWMMQLPGEFEVSDIRLSFRDVIASIGLQIKTADDPPADWKSVPIVAAFDGRGSGRRMGSTLWNCTSTPGGRNTSASNSLDRTAGSMERDRGIRTWW